MGEVTLSTGEFKALSSQTRTQILKLLEERNHTLTELSTKMKMSSPTVKQHLNVLVENNLIELRDEGRKWKYYALTRKGKNITQPAEQTQFLIVLSMASIAVIALLLIVFYPQISLPMPGVMPAEDGRALVASTDAAELGLPASPLEDSKYVLPNGSALDRQQKLEFCQEECQDCDPFEDECDNDCEQCVKE